MTTKQIIVPAFHLGLLFTGAVIAVASYSAGLGLPTEPGPGFLPMGTGILLFFASLFGLRGEVKRAGDTDGLSAPIKPGKRVVIVVLSLGAYAFALSGLGYLLSTFFFMLILFSLAEGRRWPIVALKTVVTTLLTYLVFEKWLACQLSQGILGF